MVVVVLVRRPLTPLTKLLVELHPPALPLTVSCGSPKSKSLVGGSNVKKLQSIGKIEVQNQEGLPFLHSVIVNSVMDNVKKQRQKTEIN